MKSAHNEKRPPRSKSSNQLMQHLTKSTNPAFSPGSRGRRRKGGTDAADPDAADPRPRRSQSSNQLLHRHLMNISAATVTLDYHRRVTTMIMITMLKRTSRTARSAPPFQVTSRPEPPDWMTRVNVLARLPGVVLVGVDPNSVVVLLPPPLGGTLQPHE